MDEIEMVMEYQRTQDADLRQRLIDRFLDIAHAQATAAHKKWAGDEYGDLLAFAVFGIVLAIDTYDRRRKTVLSTHVFNCCWWRIQSMRRVHQDYKRANHTRPLGERVFPVRDPGPKDVDTEDQLRAALAPLTEEQKDIIRMHYLEGLSDAEIADRLGGISRKGVYTRRRACLELCRRAVKGWKKRSA